MFLFEIALLAVTMLWSGAGRARASYVTQHVLRQHDAGTRGAASHNVHIADHEHAGRYVGCEHPSILTHTLLMHFCLWGDHTEQASY